MKRGQLVKNKSAQFYLMAAIIISVIVMSFVTISNYSKKTLVNVEDFGDEISIESEKVLDFGSYNGYGSSLMQELMENFSTDSINNLRQGKDSYFIFGSRSSITVVAYSESGKTIYVDAGAGKVSMNINAKQISSQDFSVSSNSATLTINGEDYEFGLKSGQNFYFVLLEKIEGEEYAVTNK